MTSDKRITRDAFASQLGTLSSADFERFALDVFAARGWTISRDGATVHLERGSGSVQRTVLVVDAAQTVASDAIENADVVVAVRASDRIERLIRESDTEFWGSDKLYELVHYGMDRETADNLVRDYLSRPLEWDPTADSPEPIRDGDPKPADSTPAPPAATVERNAVSTRIRRLADRFRERDPRPTDGVFLLLLLGIVSASVVGAAGGFSPTTFGGDDSSDGEPGQSGVPDSTTTYSPRATGSRAPPTSETRESKTDTPAAQPRYVGLRPTCERPPELVVTVILGALRNDDPGTNNGIRTAWNFTVQTRSGANYNSFTQFIQAEKFEPLFTYRRAEFGPVNRDRGNAVQTVTLSVTGGTARSYTFVLSKKEDGSEECWRLAGILVND